MFSFYCSFYLIQSNLLFGFHLSNSLLIGLLDSLQLLILVFFRFSEYSFSIHQPMAHIIHLTIESRLPLLLLLLCLILQVLYLDINSLYLTWD